MISVVFPAAVAPRIDREFGDLTAAAMATNDPAALTAHERAMDEWWAASRDGVALSRVAPVLIGYGAEDIVIPPANAELLAARFPGARVERFAGAGHGFPAQDPEAAADLFAAALRV
jgi:pimeloyl-ACP methyl ester carboxylesterase